MSIDISVPWILLFQSSNMEKILRGLFFLIVPFRRDASNRPTQVVEENITPRMKAQKKLGKPQQRKKKGKGKW